VLGTARQQGVILGAYPRRSQELKAAAHPLE
jgi:hypothetical protein